jgi:ABC-type transport system substrate-binding protein
MWRIRTIKVTCRRKRQQGDPFMSNSDNYWLRRTAASRLSRRRFVGGAAVAGVGAASLGLVGCGDDDDDGGSPATAPSGSTTAAPSAAASATAAGTPAVQKQKGGNAHFTSANATYDTFDADRTRFGPMGTLLGLANQSVVGWTSFTEAKIGGYFAQSWEQPDKQTYVFKVRDGLTWHNKPPVNGRAANAKDIVFHIQRNKAGLLKDGTTKDPNFYRKPLFEVVDKVEAVDDKTVKVTLTKPWPFLLNTLAGTWTKVQAPEAVDKFEAEYAKFSAEQIIGTGDFFLSDFKSEGSLTFKRHEKASRVPNWDQIDYIPLFTDPAALQAAFEQKQIDAYAPSQISVVQDLLKRLEGKIYEVKVFTPNPVLSAWYGGAPPWSDQRLISAIMRVMDRRGLIQQLLQGRGAISAWMPPAWAPFALPEKELITFPGYLEDRNKDLTEAKASWEAAGGPALGEILVDIPDIFEGLYAGVGAIISNQLKAALGNDFKVKIEPYSTITAKLVGQKYGGTGGANVWFGWGNPPADPDTSLSYINTLKSTAANNAAYAVKMPKMDGICDALSQEFDVNKRITLNHEAAREALTYTGGGLTGLFEGISNILYWNYFKIGEITHQETILNAGRDLWFDQKDPTWAGRKA